LAWVSLAACDGLRFGEYDPYRGLGPAVAWRFFSSVMNAHTVYSAHFGGFPSKRARGRDLPSWAGKWSEVTGPRGCIPGLMDRPSKMKQRSRTRPAWRHTRPIGRGRLRLRPAERRTRTLQIPDPWQAGLAPGTMLSDGEACIFRRVVCNLGDLSCAASPPTEAAAHRGLTTFAPYARR
jgi:hypothetical protein